MFDVLLSAALVNPTAFVMLFLFQCVFFRFNFSPNISYIPYSILITSNALSSNHNKPLDKA